MVQEYRNCIDKIDSTQSYIGRVSTRGKSSVNIHYLNLGILKCLGLNEGARIKYIDRAVLAFENVVSMKEDYDVDVNGGEFQVHYFAGFDIDTQTYREFQIVCESVELRLLADSKLSLHMWSPYDMGKDLLSRFLEVEL